MQISWLRSFKFSFVFAVTCGCCMEASKRRVPFLPLIFLLKCCITLLGCLMYIWGHGNIAVLTPKSHKRRVYPWNKVRCHVQLNLLLEACYDHLQIFTFLSRDPDTMICFEGWASQHNTGPAWPVSFFTTWPVLRSQINSWLSSDPDMIHLPWTVPNHATTQESLFRCPVSANA